MTINFYLPRYKSKNPEQTIFCRVYEDKKELNLNTGCKVDPKFWDKERQRISIRKTKNPQKKSEHNTTNEILDAYLNRIRNIEKEVRKIDPTTNFDTIINRINNSFNKKELTFFASYEEFLVEKERSRNIKVGTLKKYKRLQRLMTDFQNHRNRKIIFNEVNEDLLNEFFNYMVYDLKKPFLNATAFKNIQLTKVFLTWCKGKKYIKEDIKFKSERIKDNEVIYLTNDELMKLYNLSIKNDKLNRVRDVFCFQCFTGQRYSDIQKISRDDIKNGVWTFRSTKTEEILNVPLNPMALGILSKYQGWNEALPIISNQKMNEYLKELCKLAEFNSIETTSRKRGNQIIETKKPKYEYIGTHTARRTFITLSLEKGMKPDVIMKITGHSDYRMMKKYLDIADKHLRDEVDKAWGSGLRIANI